MARIASPEGLRPSLIDRLIDPESEGTSWRRGYSIEQVIDAVRKDLEDLLNTHRSGLDIPEELVEVRRSIVGYGLPDPSAFGNYDQDVAMHVCAAIEEAIAAFEPRLVDIQVRHILGGATKAFGLNLEIRAMLRLDPSPELSFVTLLKLTTGETTVQLASG